MGKTRWTNLKKAKTTLLENKIMTTVFWNTKGVIFILITTFGTQVNRSDV